MFLRGAQLNQLKNIFLNLETQAAIIIIAQFLRIKMHQFIKNKEIYLDNIEKMINKSINRIRYLKL